MHQSPSGGAIGGAPIERQPTQNKAPANGPNVLFLFFYGF